jgi:hypothetical protein
MSPVLVSLPEDLCLGGSDPNLTPEEAVFAEKAVAVLEDYLQPGGKTTLKEAMSKLLEMLTLKEPKMMQERMNGLTDDSISSLSGSPDREFLLRLHWAEHTTHDNFSDIVMHTGRSIPYDNPAQVKLARLLSVLTPAYRLDKRVLLHALPSSCTDTSSDAAFLEVLLHSKQFDCARTCM